MSKVDLIISTLFGLALGCQKVSSTTHEFRHKSGSGDNTLSSSSPAPLSTLPNESVDSHTASIDGSRGETTASDDMSEGECLVPSPKLSLVAAVQQSPLELEIPRLINQHRANLGLGILVAAAPLQEQAKVHSTQMAEGTSPLGHDGYFERCISIEKALQTVRCAENIAAHHASAKASVDKWLANSKYRENIEGDFNMTGISAVEKEPSVWYYTQIFAK